jgi:3' terminal RNA ribose 2'-O-methyltransferase Hen1
MQIEITLRSDNPDLSARDLGYLLHKHPDHLHERTTAQGKVSIFFPETGADRSRAVVHLDVDPIALVRGKGDRQEGPLAQYVNDRPYAANSLLSVAMARALGQTMAGRSKERQALADSALDLSLRIVPVAIAGGAEIAERLFVPLGYQVAAIPLDGRGARGIHDLCLRATARLADALNHVYVLVPVLDNAKHYWIGDAEIETLLARAGAWLPGHPEKALIVRRALKHRRGLVEAALERLEEAPPAADETPAGDAESALERPMRLHEVRLDAVCDVIRAEGARRVLDLGCGEGRLIRKLIRMQGIDQILGVDPSIRALDAAARRLHLHDAGTALRDRVALQQGSLTYGDRRWQGFDAATLVEVIEHIDPPRLDALECALFGIAAPQLVVVTTPNRDYNVLFEGLEAGALRHRDHRFEWSRAEVRDWGDGVAARYGYAVTYVPLGPVDGALGGPSQMAIFRKAGQ